jgi:hypothetical protein
VRAERVLILYQRSAPDRFEVRMLVRALEHHVGALHGARVTTYRCAGRLDAESARSVVARMEADGELRPGAADRTAVYPASPGADRRRWWSKRRPPRSLAVVQADQAGSD